MKRIETLLAVLFLLVGMGSNAPAQEENKQPQVVKLTLHPAAPPRPALFHRLVLDPLERKAGNAALCYYRAQVAYGRIPNEMVRQYARNYTKWESSPCEGETREQMRAWIQATGEESFLQLREASYRERCDFEYRLHEQPALDAIAFLLPEVQEMRTLSRLMRVRARVLIAERKYSEAAEALRIGFQMAKDAGKEPNLSCGLVGVAMAGTMNGEVEHWIGSADSPNLYWSLTAIPQPWIEFRPAMEIESRVAEQMFPFLKDAETARRTPAEWRNLIGNAAWFVKKEFIVSPAKEPSDADREEVEKVAKTLLERGAPIAKAWLKKNGFDAGTLDGMPDGQLIAIHTRRLQREIENEWVKGVHLPTAQSGTHFAEMEVRMKNDCATGGPWEESLPVSRYWSTFCRVFFSQSRMENDFAALRTLEALRAHLAETGSLPKSLDEIKVVPVPISPVTNEPFAYRLTDEGAVLDVPSPRPNDPPSLSKRYVLTAAPKAK